MDSHEKFLNLVFGPIGKTASTRSEPNTTSHFHFWISDEAAQKGNIEIGNIIGAHSAKTTHIPDDVTFGIVTEMRTYSDIDSFISDFLSHDFGKAGLSVPTDIPEVIVVTCSVMNNLSGKTKPVDKAVVYYPSELGIQFAYGIVNTDAKIIFSGSAIPIGIFQNGDDTISEICVDDDFLLGPESAHLNVSGISGLASKTSAIQFVLKSLLARTNKKVAIVMFNVKSKDLLFIDKPNSKLQSDAWSMEAYGKLGIDTHAFNQVRFFAPIHNSRILSERNSADVQGFSWNLPMLKEDIPDLFDSDEWDDKMEGLWYEIKEHIDSIDMKSYAQLLNWINQVISNANSQNQQWPLNHNLSTWRKMYARLGKFPKTYKGLISTDAVGTDVPISTLKDKDIYVIDIEKLDDRGKRLIFGRVVNEIKNKLNSDKLKVEKVVIFVDELNKFAPSSNVRSPLKKKLVEITARGRSLGLVLFGAEQFASTVEKEIVENCSTYLFGRTESNELSTANYSRFSPEIKSKLSMLGQGRLLAKFAKFPQPIFIRFPYPPCSSGDTVSGISS